MARKNSSVKSRNTRGTKTYTTPKYTQYAMYRSNIDQAGELVRVLSQAGDYLSIEYGDGTSDIVHLATLNFVKR